MVNLSQFFLIFDFWRILSIFKPHTLNTYANQMETYCTITIIHVMKHTGTNRGFTHTGWHSEKFNRFLPVLPKITGIRWKWNGKSRAFREMGILLVVKRNNVVDLIRIPKKSNYKPIQAGNQKISTDLSVCYPNQLESGENEMKSLGPSEKLAFYWLWKRSLMLTFTE